MSDTMIQSNKLILFLIDNNSEGLSARDMLVRDRYEVVFAGSVMEVELAVPRHKRIAAFVLYSSEGGMDLTETLRARQIIGSDVPMLSYVHCKKPNEKGVIGTDVFLSDLILDGDSMDSLVDSVIMSMDWRNRKRGNA